MISKVATLVLLSTSFTDVESVASTAKDGKKTLMKRESKAQVEMVHSGDVSHHEESVLSGAGIGSNHVEIDGGASLASFDSGKLKDAHSKPKYGYPACSVKDGTAISDSYPCKCSKYSNGKDIICKDPHNGQVVGTLDGMDMYSTQRCTENPILDHSHCVADCAEEAWKKMCDCLEESWHCQQFDKIGIKIVEGNDPQKIPTWWPQDVTCKWLHTNPNGVFKKCALKWKKCAEKLKLLNAACKGLCTQKIHRLIHPGVGACSDTDMYEDWNNFAKESGWNLAESDASSEAEEDEEADEEENDSANLTDSSMLESSALDESLSGKRSCGQ